MKLKRAFASNVGIAAGSAALLALSIAVVHKSHPSDDEGAALEAAYRAAQASGADATGASGGATAGSTNGHLSSRDGDSDADAGEDDDRPYEFRLPSGRPTALACEEARRIVEQVRTGLAYEPDRVQPSPFADATSDWLDPHGLWSLPEDAPALAALKERAPSLLRELQGETADTQGCDAALKVGAALAQWVDQLRGEYERARDSAEKSTAAAESSPASEPQAQTQNGSGDADDPAALALALAPLASDAVTAARDVLPALDTSPGGGRALASELGRRAGRWLRDAGSNGQMYEQAARDRFFPALDAEGWSRVVLAAAVRAYVPFVDPHGAWAPFDEESSVYEVDLVSRPPSRLWARAQPTALGVRVTEGAEPPLQDGDVILALAGVPTAGLPLEQIDQLGYASADARGGTMAVVVRGDDPIPRSLTILEAVDEPDAEAAADEKGSLLVDRVHFGDGDGLIVAIHDVRDDLGDELTRVLAREKEKSPAPVALLLDLRGNGGGSTDGALDALGIFLPGAPMFPMKRRDGTLETDRAPEPPRNERWNGPVATLVDAATASAAEMIAGALSSYRRGPSVGETTYGKGCAQEYLDDDAHTGVLRLTTLLYALPDGTPVQRIGLSPTLRIPLSGKAETDPDDREATLPHSPPTWRGPDVRMFSSFAGSTGSAGSASDAGIAAWPSVAASNVGPCKDPDICRALRALAGANSHRVSAKTRP